MKYSLDIRNLNKTYEGFALQNVSFTLPKGYIMGFIGPNGAGKTTTIKSVLQLVLPDSGHIEVMGHSIEAGDPDLKNEIGVVMDFPFFADEWKAKDVEKALAPFYTRWDHARYEHCLKEFHLPDDKKIKCLSRGMKVKLMLAVALSHHAGLLLLDEPTSGLDPVARDELMEILEEYISDGENSILFSTHITSDLEKIADFITYIRNGRIEYTGEKDVLIEQFMIAKGGRQTLGREQKKQLIGYHEHSVGFDGMIRTEDRYKMPPDVMYEKISLDEMIVYMSKEDRHA